MDNDRDVHIELVSGSLNDYVVKDKAKILIGRFIITDMDKENKKCNIKLKFYKEDNYDLLKETLELILKAIYKDGYIYKVNVLVKEDINLKPFLDLGFTLEAILSENLIVKGNHIDELSFGINRNEFVNCNKVNLIQLQGKNISVRNLTPGDAEQLLEYYIRNEEHLKEFEPTRDAGFYTQEVQKEMLLESYRNLMAGTSIDFGIFIDRKLIGKVKISNIVYGVFKNGIIGYSIDKEFQGRGYMKEAVNLALQYAKEYLDLHRVEASVLLSNNKSKNVLLACGFKEIGINEKYLFINGKWRDHITFYKIL